MTIYIACHLVNKGKQAICNLQTNEVINVLGKVGLLETGTCSAADNVVVK